MNVRFISMPSVRNELRDLMQKFFWGSEQWVSHRKTQHEKLFLGQQILL